MALGMTTSIAACNTMEGMGEDVSEGGQALENEAEEYDNY
jgi:predicted small secreted protein